MITVCRDPASIHLNREKFHSKWRGLADPLGRITFCLIGKLVRNDDDRTLKLAVRDPMRIGGKLRTAGVAGSVLSSPRKHQRPYDRKREDSHSKSECDDAHAALLEFS